MHSAGRFLASSLYRKDLTILLSGELGSGKTTFAQGLAEGLGISDRVVSPSFALEQHYDESFTHIDLYRLSPIQAKEFLEHSSERKGIRVIEWAERTNQHFGPHIAVRFDDDGAGRILTCDFNDEPVPDEREIKQWYKDVRLADHIQKHVKAVADVSMTLAHRLMKDTYLLVRLEALNAAALAHDLLRYVDFEDWHSDVYYKASEEDIAVWTTMKAAYGTPHENAARKFLEEKGYPAIGRMLHSHRGLSSQTTPAPETTEQLILAYADKRVRFDTVVSLDERFRDLATRHAKYHADTEKSEAWYRTMRALERKLFPEGEPEL